VLVAVGEKEGKVGAEDLMEETGGADAEVDTEEHMGEGEKEGDYRAYKTQIESIVEQTQPDTDERCYGDEFLLAMKDLIKKVSGIHDCTTSITYLIFPTIQVYGMSGAFLDQLSTTTGNYLPPTRPIRPSAAVGVSCLARRGPAGNDTQQQRPWTATTVPRGLEFSRDALKEPAKEKEVAYSENAWTPGRARRRQQQEVEGEGNQAEELEKAKKIFRRLLNKITPTTYEELAADFCSHKIYSSEEHGDLLLDNVVEVIFQKSIDEPAYCSIYADLCQKQCDEEMRDAKTKKFSQAIIRRCQSKWIGRAGCSCGHS